MGIVGVWLSIAIDLYVRAIFLFFKFKKVKEGTNKSVNTVTNIS